MRISLLLISLLGFACSSATVQPTNPLLGSWTMKEIHYIDSDATHSQPEAYTGTFIFTQNRYAILYNPWTQARVPFNDLSKPTDDEILASFKTIVFNSGQYSFTDSTVSTQADIAKVPGFEGGQQFYEYSLEKGVLDITMVDETYPDGTKPEWFGKLKVRFVLERE